MRTRTLFGMCALGAVALGAAAVVVSAQQPLAPGVQRARENPVTMHPHDLEASYIRMPLPAGQEKYGKLDGTRMKTFVNEITAVSRKSRDDGELLWGRQAGTKYDDMVEGIVEGKFKEWGLANVRR